MNPSTVYISIIESIYLIYMFYFFNTTTDFNLIHHSYFDNIKILKHIHQGKIESAYSIGNNQAEIIHAQALKTSRLINKNIEEAKLPGGIRLGLIKKKDKIIIPDKSTIIEQNDEVLFLCLTSDLKKAEELFQVRNVF